MDTSAALRRIFAFLALILACCLIAAFGMALATRSASARADRRLKTLGDLGQVLVTMTNAETSQRGYLLTGDVAYLKPSVLANGTMEMRLDAIDQDIKASGIDPNEARALREAANAKMAEIQETINLYSHGAKDQAIAEVKTNRGMQLKEKAEDLLRRMLLAQSIELQRDRARDVADTIGEVAIFGLATLISFGSLGLAYLRIKFVSEARLELSEELRDQKDLLEVTLSSIGDGVIVTDLDGYITFMNDVALELTGRERGASIGAPCASIFTILNEETRQPLEDPVAKVIHAGGIVDLSDHTVLIRPNGTEVPIDDCGAPIRDEEGNMRGIVLVFRDFSAHREAQKKLHVAVEEAASASASKDNFLARLSHELRTPLTPLKATLGEWKKDPNLPEAYKKDIDIMLRSVVLEARLIDDLLDLGRITRAQLRVDHVTVDANGLIREVIDLLSADVRSKSLILDTDLRAKQSIVLGDAARLQQVFWNILRNAIKFTPSEGRITIRSSNPVSGRLRVEFTDTGLGMSAKTVSRVFHPFEHGPDEIVQKYGGLGLGMAISQALIDAHDGSIEAASDGEGKGSTFVVTLAAASGTADPVHRPGEDLDLEDAPQSYSILLVEDHEDSAYVIGRLLSRHGHEVRTVSTVEAALLAFEKAVPDILISDLGLPDRSGLDLIREVRVRFGPSIAAIALSGYGYEEDITKSMAAGFNQHVTKPVSFQRLVNAIREVAT